MLDADAFLTDPITLKALVSKGLPIAAPMLLSDGFYSNFWSDINFLVNDACCNKVPKILLFNLRMFIPKVYLYPNIK